MGPPISVGGPHPLGTARGMRLWHVCHAYIYVCVCTVMFLGGFVSSIMWSMHWLALGFSGYINCCVWVGRLDTR